MFSRNSVAEQLNTIIKNYKEEDSITFGIIGDWGSGKTSFVNMTLEDFKDDENFIIVKFNPWNISTRKKLISDFFTTLAKEIRKASFPKFKIKNLKKIYSHAKFKFLSEVPNKLEDLSLLFKMSSYMIADPVASVAMSRASSIINNFNKLLSVEKKGLDEIKNEINTALLNIDIKIIIVIDDLDRLADTDIQEIFQLVRSIADFKNTIYILSYDEEIVSKALDKIQKDKGGKYIEKIVQVPIKLPKVS
ncbi:NTPase, partial [Campylobacter coli]|nr:NTPase [Campylobacter coli]